VSDTKVTLPDGTTVETSTRVGKSADEDAEKEVDLTELYDLEVGRHDGVANPASGFSFLVTKSK
jgi:hypothetical protein